MAAADLNQCSAGDPAAVLLADEGPVGDAQQGVVRLGLRLLGVVDVIGGDQRHVMVIGPVDQTPLGLALRWPGRGAAARHRSGRRTPAAIAARAAWPSAALPWTNSGSTGPSGPPDSRISPSECADDLVPGHARLVVARHPDRPRTTGRTGSASRPRSGPDQDDGRGLGPALG